MSDAAKENLYHLVLGLPADLTAPNHYELLGLEARASDAQEIKNAAADQNGKLLSWQNSDRYPEIRALTFEIVHAKEVLLNDASRIEYDLTLGDWGIIEDGPWIVEEPAIEKSHEPLSVQCPECSAEFKLRNRDLIGRRLPCPECGRRFTVEPDREADVPLLEPVQDGELAELHNFDDMPDVDEPPRSRMRERSQRDRRSNRQAPGGDRDLFEVESLDDDDHDGYQDYETAPRKSSPRNRGRAGGESRSSEESSKWPIALGGLLMVLGVVLLMGVLATQAFAPKLVIQGQLGFIPANSGAFGYLRVSDLSRSPYFQDRLSRDHDLRDRVVRFRRQTGMVLQEVESLAIGIQDGNPDLLRARDLKVSSGGPIPRFVAVAKAIKDWDRALLIGDHTQSKTHQGQNYHEFTPAGFREPWAIYLADAKTLVFGTVDEVKAAIETEGKSPDWPAMEFLEPNYPVVAVSLSRLNAGAGEGTPPRGENRTLGGGFVWEENLGRHLTFIQHASEAAAIKDQRRATESFERMEERRGPSRTGREPTFDAIRHGRFVTLIQSHARSGTNLSGRFSEFAPIGLLAYLGQPATGESSLAGPDPLAQAPNVDPAPLPEPPGPEFMPEAGLAPRPQTKPADPQLLPAPIAAALDALIAQLKNSRSAGMPRKNSRK